MKLLRRKSELIIFGIFIWIFITHLLYVSVLRLDVGIDVLNPQEFRRLIKVLVQNKVTNKHICIAAVVLIRIYRGDNSELTTYEVEQWIRYLQYAGVDEVYLYDAYEEKEEKLEYWVRKLFGTSEVYYHDWHKYTPYEITKTQHSAYQHAIDHYKNQCEWHLAMDIDEYPFVLTDIKPGFLKRLIRMITSECPDCVEISFPNYVFSGYPNNYSWLIERVQRRSPNRTNLLDKPLYLAKNISKARVHHNSLIDRGMSVDIYGSIARINHYWGARVQDWKPDTKDSLSKTIKDASIMPILSILKSYSLLSNKMSAYVTNRFWNL